MNHNEKYKDFLEAVEKSKLDFEMNDDAVNKSESILEWSSDLKEINTDNIEPMFNVIELITQETPYFNDEVKSEDYNTEDLLMNTDIVKSNYVSVYNVVKK